MFVDYARDGKNVGSILDKWSCCEHELEIYDASGTKIYIIRTSFWQIGLCCGRNAETVAEIDFKILSYPNFEEVGHIIKIPSIFDKMAQTAVFAEPGFHDSSNSFTVNFPPNCPPEHKFLLIIAAIKCGYQFFTKNVNQCCAKCNMYCNNCCNICCCPCRTLIRFCSCCACYCPMLLC